MKLNEERMLKEVMDDKDGKRIKEDDKNDEKLRIK